MQARFGVDAFEKREGRESWSRYDPTLLNNGHMLVLGESGSGKTTLLKDAMAQMIANCPAYERPGQPTRFHIFDTHEDIDPPGASEVQFSQATPYGLNPLKVGADPHFGGVLRCVEDFIVIVERATGVLGGRQVAVLRNILLDVYKMHGFDPKRPQTWVVDERTARPVSDGSDNRLYLDIPFDEKDEAKRVAEIRWDDKMKVAGRAGLWWIPLDEYQGGITRWRPMTLGRTHPTLSDVIRFTDRLVMMNFIGTDQEAVTAFEAFQKTVKKLRKLTVEAARDGRERPDGGADGNGPRERARDDALKHYEAFLNKSSTGDEVTYLIKYGSRDILHSVLDRLKSLEAAGIFKNEEPDFDPRARVWRYRLRPLRAEAQQMFVLFSLNALMQRALERGQTDRIVEVAVVDETRKFVDEDGNDILSKITAEARKFGLVIIACNQDADLPKLFISSMATKVIVGLDRTRWPSAIAKMGLDKNMLAFVKPFQTCVVQSSGRVPFTGQWRPVIFKRGEAPVAERPVPRYAHS